MQKHLILGGLFAVLAVFIFLGNVRTTLISAVALPISIIATFALIRAFGFTFNNMTMLAPDPLRRAPDRRRHHRHREHLPPCRGGDGAARGGDLRHSEIGLAVMATTFAIVAIFLPVAFMKGMIGRFFLQFALTVVFSVLVSLLVSFTLTPMLASLFLKPARAGDSRSSIEASAHGLSTAARMGDWLERGYDEMEGVYRRLLAFSLNRRKIVLVLPLSSSSGASIMTKFMGKEFIPPEDQGQFIVRLEAPIDYSVDKADELFRPAEEIVREMPEVTGLYYSQGGGRFREINRPYS